MKKHAVGFTILLAASLTLLGLSGCKKNDESLNPIASSTAQGSIQTDQKKGTLTLATGSTLVLKDLKVVGAGGTSDLDQSGGFAVSSVVAKKYQPVIFSSKVSGNPVYLGLYDPASHTTKANDTSTVLCLLALNPNLALADQAHRQSYLQAAMKNSKFPQLLSLFRTAVASNAETALDLDANPTLYQTAVQIMKETIDGLASGALGKVGNVQFGGTPSIEDASGDNITFVNPRHVWYAAGIYPNDQSLSDVVPVQRQKEIVGLQWAWPPITVNEPAQTNYSLGNGYFRIYLTRGMDFSKLLLPNDPVGRATILNTAESIITLIDLIMGFAPDTDVLKLPHYFVVTASRAYSLTEAILQGDAVQFLKEFCGLVWDNRGGIALWIWEDTQNNAAGEFIGSISKIVGNVAWVMKVLSFANGAGPFIYDMIFSPQELTFYITQQNGVITTNTQNAAPSASFTVSPPAGIVSTAFTFDASSSVDDHDALSALQFRWDWESDGTWDTQWSHSSSATHSFSKSASYVVTLAVADSKGLVGTTTMKVNVGGGQGTASHIKLFMDAKPWYSDALTNVLSSLGFSAGTGSNSYEILTSDLMATEPLLPGTDLVIIANDQPQTFYDNYASNQIRFTSFSYNGGALFWEACDQGWNEGSMATAGVILPGSVSANFYLDIYNYIPTPSLPLVAGLPTTMDHNYASHEDFSNLLSGTTVYCTDGKNLPTLIEFNFGSGWIIMSGQPLEHQYDHIYNLPGMEKLLPRIVAYFTGKPLSKRLARTTVTQSARPSHLSR